MRLYRALAVVSGIALLWVVWLWLGLQRTVSQLPVPSGHTSSWASAEWAHLPADGERCILANNVWNRRSAGQAFEQEVFVEELGGKRTFGWSWNATWKMRHTVVSYPELICGNKPWDEPIGVFRGLPFHPGDRQISVDYNIRLRASGNYNMAFSLWAVSALPATPKTIRAEIMIWIANSDQQPAGTPRGTVTVAGVPYDLFINERQEDATGSSPQPWVYAAFVASSPQLGGPLNLSAFIDDLEQRGLLTHDLWVTNVELGNEVSEGKGIAEIQDFSLHVNDVARPAPAESSMLSVPSRP
jgi:hypothetical protein